MKFAKRALLVCALSSTFLLSACYTVHVDESEVSNLESANTSSPDLTNIERNRRAHELERIDSMVKSKPKKRPAENTLYQQRIDEVSRSLRNLCTNPQNKAYFDKTPCLPAGMKRAYLEDNSYPTEVQRIVAARVFKEMNNLNTTTHTRSCAQRETSATPKTQTILLNMCSHAFKSSSKNSSRGK